MSPQAEDHELLRSYAEDQSEAAFRELVNRHINLVYAGALRRLGGDAHLAQDVTQRVFTALAAGARSLAGRPALAGWLHITTRNQAAQIVRTERRRRTREQEACKMNESEVANTSSSPDWERLRPVMDGALDELDERDREAVLLRYFEGKSFGELGARLGLSENAARMRVERALDRMHGLLARRGVTSTVGALALALAGETSIAAPAGLAATVSGAALSAGTAGGLGLLASASATKLAVMVGVVAVLAAGGIYRNSRKNQTVPAVAPGAPVPFSGGEPAGTKSGGSSRPDTEAVPAVGAVPGARGIKRPRMIGPNGMILTQGKPLEMVYIQYWAERYEFEIGDDELVQAQEAYNAIVEARRKLEDGLAQEEQLAPSHFKVVIPAYTEEGRKLLERFGARLASILGADRAKRFLAKIQVPATTANFGWGTADQVLDVTRWRDGNKDAFEILHGFGLPGSGAMSDITSVSKSYLLAGNLGIYEHLRRHFPSQSTPHPAR
ncbi:MAG TPA: sigma-70 family RNA polymerase sigma factor [Lacunisphaera sp.]|nr:sigma-70 family RNA polymerase sigma factor [Lacunisphaera sp.]